MQHEYRKLLLSQLRLAVYSRGAAGTVDDAQMVRALTVNANLSSLGYMLNAADLLRLACSPSLDTFHASLAELTDQVLAEPMYPGFPAQVMCMEEAVFRFHQAVHYFSTYGQEALLGVRVSRGWLPDMPSAPRTEEPERLLPERVLELIDEADCYLEPVRRILRKSERMNIPEREIVREAVRHLSAQEIASLKIPFKENLALLAEAIFSTVEPGSALPLLHALHQHTGDVLETIGHLLRRNRWHFRTSQKRLLVRLIERYPVQDWRANVILSRRKARSNLLLLDYLDYGMYTRSPEHMAVVNSLRDGELKSWEGQARCLLAQGAEGALDFVGKRPGMLLRMTAWLIRMGYDPDRIARKLCDGAAALSVQTLVTVLNHFGNSAEAGSQPFTTVYDVLERALRMRLSLSRTPLKGRRVFVDDGGMALDRSVLRCSGKSAEGGYIPSGVEYRIPDGVRYIRFFVYWNDRRRVDVDLHAAIRGASGDIQRVGWNADFNTCGVVHSGDITHSDAAEYIDVDLEGGGDRVALNLHLFSGCPSFGEMEVCFTGLMAVSSLRENQRLYSPANCFFSHNLRSSCTNLSYGYLDVKRRTLVFVGVPLENVPDMWYSLKDPELCRMSIARYLQLLLEAQGCTPAGSREEADVVLVTGKPSCAKELSLVDANFFMDAAPIRPRDIK